ncbi:NAD-dependent epimerase/dehydratase family protein [Gemmatimonadota bacterium]
MRPNGSVALVTGSAGFVGREMVRVLLREGFTVRAGVRRPRQAALFGGAPGIKVCHVELHDRDSLERAVEGVDTIYHFAAQVKAVGGGDLFREVNVTGTERLWDIASRSGVTKALYCSTASVYGLLASSHVPISEDIAPRAMEPYGSSKLQGEQAALLIGESRGIATCVIRPAAIFGPGENSAFGGAIRSTAFSRLLTPGNNPRNRFNFVHVSDVAEAAFYLIQRDVAAGEVYNIPGESPISFEEAFASYLRVLDRCGRSYWRQKVLARLSHQIQKRQLIHGLLSRSIGLRLTYSVWQLDRELIYSSQKLLDTGFRYHWSRFEDVLASCLEQSWQPGSMSVFRED